MLAIKKLIPGRWSNGVSCRAFSISGRLLPALPRACSTAAGHQATLSWALVVARNANNATAGNKPASQQEVRYFTAALSRVVSVQGADVSAVFYLCCARAAIQFR